MKRKIAIWKNVKHDFTTVDDDSMEGMESYVQLTEYIEAYFPEREPEQVVTEQIDKLQESKKEILAAAETAVQEVDRRIGELLAITHQPETSDG